MVNSSVEKSSGDLRSTWHRLCELDKCLPRHGRNIEAIQRSLIICGGYHCPDTHLIRLCFSAL